MTTLRTASLPAALAAHRRGEPTRRAARACHRPCAAAGRRSTPTPGRCHHQAGAHTPCAVRCRRTGVHARHQALAGILPHPRLTASGAADARCAMAHAACRHDNRSLASGPSPEGWRQRRSYRPLPHGIDRAGGSVKRDRRKMGEIFAISPIFDGSDVPNRTEVRYWAHLGPKYRTSVRFSGRSRAARDPG